MDCDSIITCRVSYALKQQVKEFQQKYHMPTEKQAIVQLIQTGLYVDSRREEIANPEIVDFLKQHLYDSMLADWFHDLDLERLTALYGAIRDARELKLRGKV